MVVIVRRLIQNTIEAAVVVMSLLREPNERKSSHQWKEWIGAAMMISLSLREWSPSTIW
mgnify:CR=1 FL=1